ncbi:hypothetical protein JCM8097_003173 [Rhodosporidiobolus ruineniae]
MAQHYSNSRRYDNRPQPLALNHGAYQQQHQHHYHHTQQQQHSAPLPRQQYAHNQAANPPLTAAWNQFQSDQLAYLAEMERSLALQQELQRQIVVQQQVEAAKAEQQYRLMLAAQQGQAQGQYGGGVYAQQQQAQRGYHTAPHQQANVQFYPPVDPQPAPAQAHDPNPLVASALARRAKRQSYNGAGPVGGEQQQHPHAAYPGQVGQYHTPSGPGTPRNVQDQRRSPSPYTGYHGAFGQSASPSPSSRGPRRPSPPPPAVILSAPGEPYPDTSSSGSSSSRATSEDGGSESGETRPSSPEREKDASSSPAALKAAKQQRRRSHLDSLAGLGSHASNRRQQNGGNGPQQGQRALGVNGGGASKNPHQRAVSSPASSQQTSPSSPAAPSPLFSSARAMPPPVPGTSSAIRQPRGPPTELGDQNFSARIRARAVGEIKGLAKRRASGNVLAAPGAPVGVEELAQGMRAVAVC